MTELITIDYSHASRHIATLTFGRETAQFKQLITYLAILSIVLWTLVLISTVIRMSSVVIYRQRKSQVVTEKTQT